jgi:sugar/nucleoside kinase (ribokinase family)
MPFLMLGEALVDPICEQAAEGLADAGAFTPHFGGAARVVATIGAGDAFFGTLLARPQAAVWNASDPALGDALAAAVETGARATETWGAVA